MVTTCCKCKESIEQGYKHLGDGGKIYCAECSLQIHSGGDTNYRLKVLESKVKHIEKKLDLLSSAFVQWKKTQGG